MQKYFIFTIAILFLFSCSSPETKATKIIKEYFNEHRVEGTTYKPIGSTFKVAYNTYKKDSVCQFKAMNIIAVNDTIKNYENVIDSLAHMILPYYARKGGYYRELKYLNILNRYKEQNNILTKLYDHKNYLLNDLKLAIQQVDTSLVIGYEVLHQFNSIEQDTVFTTYEYRFIIDSVSFKIIDIEDINSKDLKVLNEIFDDAINEKKYTNYKYDEKKIDNEIKRTLGNMSYSIKYRKVKKIII